MMRARPSCNGYTACDTFWESTVRLDVLRWHALMSDERAKVQAWPTCRPEAVHVGQA
jgi:hypothetical protein